MIKIIGLDIDGTLLNSKKELTQRTKIALHKAQEQGIKLVIASGRPVKGVLAFAEMLDFKNSGGFLLNYNGSKVTNYATGEVVIDHTIDIDLAREYLQFLDDKPVDFLLYYADDIYTKNKDAYWVTFTHGLNGMGIVEDPDLATTLDLKLNNILIGSDPDLLIPISEEIIAKFGDKLSLTFSDPHYFEAMPKGVNKGTSLLEIAKHFEIKPEEVIAFGDGNNDLDMIKCAGTGIAMSNATPALREVADYITLSNDEDGVADYLEKFVLTD